jgi:glucokinase
VAYLTCGTGFGLGFVVDGEPYYGAAGTPPEIGHVRYRDDGPKAFGKVGCFEAFAAGSALSAIAAWRFPDRFGDEPPRPEEISRLAAECDDDAREVLAVNAEAVGEAAALVMDLLAPDRIALGSLALHLGESWQRKVRERFDRAIGTWFRHPVLLGPASLGSDLQDLSALAAAMRAA